MKILHLRASNFYGGPERQIHFHAKKAKESNLDITICSFSENGQQPDFLNVIAADNLKTHTFKVKNAYDFTAVKTLKDYLIKNNIDIVCSHDYRSHLIAYLSLRKLNKKWVTFSRGWTAENFKIKLYHTIEKFIVRFADKIVAVSGGQKKRLEKLFINPDKILVAHNAIDPAAFDTLDPINLQLKYKFPSDSIVAITGGRFSPEKGQLVLIDAAKIALEQNKSLRFILFGDGPLLEEARQRISKYNLDQYIITPGFEKNLIMHLKGATCLINPSLSEGLPNIVLEAMAMKIPSIATSVGGVPEMITDDYNGILVEPDNPAKLAEAILKFASNMERNNILSENGYKTIIEKFNFDTQFKTLSNLYRQLLDE